MKFIAQNSQSNWFKEYFNINKLLMNNFIDVT